MNMNVTMISGCLCSFICQGYVISTYVKIYLYSYIYILKVAEGKIDSGRDKVESGRGENSNCWSVWSRYGKK